MARRALGVAQLAIVQAVSAALAWSRGGPDAVAAVTPDDSVRAGGSIAPGDSFPSGSAVVRLGVSGGADSMVMAAGVAHVLARARRLAAGGAGSVAPPPCVEALVVDHGLFDGSAEHTAAVVAEVTRLGVPTASCRVRVTGAGGPEDAARRVRHDALWQAPTLLGSFVGEVWLAHTRDDQAEQVLLGLARGSGVRSLAGMAPRRSHALGDGATGEVVRPLLDVSRSITVEACRQWGIEPWHDPANTDPALRRSAIRAVLPDLARAMGVDLTANLVRTAQLARDDADLLDSLAERAVGAAETRDGLLVEALLDQHPALRSRVVHRWLRAQGSMGSRAHVDAVLALALHWHGQGPVDAGNGVRVSRRHGLLVPVAAVDGCDNLSG